MIKEINATTCHRALRLLGMNFKITLCCILVLVSSSSGFAQGSIDVGLYGGGVYYFGDIVPAKQFVNTHATVGAQFRWNLNPRYGFKASVGYGKLSGDDADSKYEPQRNRNLSFYTNLYEFNTTFEFNFFEFNPFKEESKFSPYSFVGLGLFYINPKADLRGSPYVLRELTTEGQAKPYSRVQLSMPFGFGLKFKVTDRILLHTQWGWHKTFTDYIDDVSDLYPNPDDLSNVAKELSDRSLVNSSGKQQTWGRQRGYSNTKDWYASAVFGVSVRLGEKLNSCYFKPPGGLSKKIKKK